MLVQPEIHTVSRHAGINSKSQAVGVSRRRISHHTLRNGLEVPDQAASNTHGNRNAMNSAPHDLKKNTPASGTKNPPVSLAHFV